MKNTGAVILAAGVSSVSKGDMLRSELDTLREAGASPIAVVTGHEEESIQRMLSHRRVVFVSNPRYGETKMFESLKLGLQAIMGECDRILVINGDTPSFSAETVRAIAEPDREIVVPSYNGINGHPFCLNRSGVGKILAYEGTGGIRGMIRADILQAETVPVDDPGILMEADAEESLREALRYQRESVAANPIHVDVQVGLARTDVFLDEELASLLEEIDVCRSMNTAARNLGISYSRGWKKIKHAEEMLGFPLVEKQTGGSQGGGSSLTERGRASLCTYRKVQRDFQRLAEESLAEFSEIPEIPKKSS